MLKKKVNLLNVLEVQAEEKPKKSAKNLKEVKPKSTYVKTIEDTELEIADGVRLVFSVAQKSDDSPAHVDIRTWVESENYNGPTKKGINFNIEFLDEIIGMLQSVSSECAKMNK